MEKTKEKICKQEIQDCIQYLMKLPINQREIVTKIRSLDLNKLPKKIKDYFKNTLKDKEKLINIIIICLAYELWITFLKYQYKLAIWELCTNTNRPIFEKATDVITSFINKDNSLEQFDKLQNIYNTFRKNKKTILEAIKKWTKSIKKDTSTRLHDNLKPSKIIHTTAWDRQETPKTISDIIIPEPVFLNWKPITKKQWIITDPALVRMFVWHIEKQFINLSNISEDNKAYYLLREMILFKKLWPKNLRLFRKKDTWKPFFIILTQRIDLFAHANSTKFKLRPLYGKIINDKSNWFWQLYAANRILKGESDFTQTWENNLIHFFEENFWLDKNKISFDTKHWITNEIILPNWTPVVFIEAQNLVLTNLWSITSLPNVWIRNIKDPQFRRIQQLLTITSQWLWVTLNFTISLVK